MNIHMIFIVIKIVISLAGIIALYFILSSDKSPKQKFISSVCSVIIPLATWFFSGAFQNEFPGETPTPIPVTTSIPEPTITQEEQDKQEIAELFARYTSDFVNAVNYQDFSYVEQTMIEGSPIYNKIKDYILIDCKQNGVHETLVEQKINIYTPNGDDSYYIDTYEVYDIQTNQSEDVDTRTFNAQYIVKKENGKWYMSDYPIEHKPYN